MSDGKEGKDNIRLIASLKQIFSLKEEDLVGAEIRKIDENTAVLIQSKSVFIFIKLDHQRQKAVTTIGSDKVGDKLQYEYEYVQFNNDFKVSTIKTAEESLADDLDTKRLAEALLLRLLLKLGMSYTEEDIHSLKILSKDTRFMQLIENTYTSFEHGFQKLMNLRINS